MHVTQDRVAAVASVLPYVLKKFPPAEFENQFVFKTQRLALVHSARSIGHAEQAMRQIGRQAGHSAIKAVAGSRVGAWIHRLQTRMGSAVRRFKAQQMVGDAQVMGQI